MPTFIPYVSSRVEDDEMIRRSAEFNKQMQRRRTIRDFSAEPVPRVVIENSIRAAGSAPNGANKQPWHFVVISDPTIKRQIREAAEAEEREFYEKRATPEWLADLAAIGTDADKPFLETAPYLIAIFGKTVDIQADGSKRKNYYVSESVGIATGMLITALHEAGLATLTHTPSPMKFLNEVLGRGSHERAFLLLVVGRPTADATVPDISRKPLAEICTFM